MYKPTRLVFFSLNGLMEQLFGRKISTAPEVPPPYQEPENDTVFWDVLCVLELPLGSASLKDVEELLFKMVERFQAVDWCA
jgi:hypothetical protein